MIGNILQIVIDIASKCNAFDIFDLATLYNSVTTHVIVTVRFLYTHRYGRRLIEGKFFRRYHIKGNFILQITFSHCFVYGLFIMLFDKHYCHECVLFACM